MKKWALLFLVAVASGAGVYVYSPETIRTLTALTEVEKPLEKSVAEEATPVGVAVTEAGVVVRYLNGLGTVVPRNSVVVKSRVDGQLMKIHFREGQVVKQGELLAEIDSRQFAAQLKQAEGQYKRDSALLSEARVNLVRFQKLATQGSIAAKQLEAQQSLVKQYEGAIENNQGQLESARLQLEYTKITAPISGRVGLRQVDTGNIVRATDSDGIVTITEVQPINVVFSIPEDDIALLRQRKASQFLRVEAWDREARRRLAVGILSAIDNQLDSTTGTLKLKAEFSNNNYVLFPNQFVNVRLYLNTEQNALMVPSAAVQRSARGAFVYVVAPDMIVSMRKVQAGVTQGNKVSIEKGLKLGEKVVVDGVDNLREGKKVEISYTEPSARAVTSAADDAAPKDNQMVHPANATDKAPKQQ